MVYQSKNLLFSFLDDRTLRVYENGVWSEEVILEAGTPQGSILSPILYLIFMNDATNDLDANQISASQYADDTGAWATRKTVGEAIHAIQIGLDQIQQWCQKWFITLNPIKSQLIVFTKCFRHKAEIEENHYTVKLFGHNISILPEVIFLGVTFDQRMTWEPQFQKLTSRAYKRLNLIRRISSLAKNPNPNTLAHLYKSLIVPIFEYSSICIISAGEVHIEKLQLVQNMSLRAITRSPRYVSINDLHDATGFEPIKNHLIAFARQRLEVMRQKSSILESIDQHSRVRHIQTNKSPLDILTT